MSSFLLQLLIILFVIFNVESITKPIGTKRFNVTTPIHLMNATNDWQISYIPDIEIEFDIIFHTLSTSIHEIFLIGDNSNDTEDTEFPRISISQSVIIINWDNPFPSTENISNIPIDITGFELNAIIESNHIYFRGTPSFVYFELNGINLKNTTFPPFEIPTSSLSDIWTISMGDANATISNFSIYAVNSCKFQCSQCTEQECTTNELNCIYHDDAEICVPDTNIETIQCDIPINGTYNFEPLIFEINSISPNNVTINGCNPDFNTAITLISNHETKELNECNVDVTTDILHGIVFDLIDDIQSFNTEEDIIYNVTMTCHNLTDEADILLATDESLPDSLWNIIWIILDIFLLILLILILIRILKPCKKRRVHQQLTQIATTCTEDDHIDILTQSEVVKPCKVNVDDDSDADQDDEQHSELQRFMDEPVEINEDDY